MKKLINIAPPLFTCRWILVSLLNFYIKEQAFFIDCFWIP
jgi:hypothetical protein